MIQMKLVFSGHQFGITTVSPISRTEWQRGVSKKYVLFRLLWQRRMYSIKQDFPQFNEETLLLLGFGKYDLIIAKIVIMGYLASLFATVGAPQQEQGLR